MINKNIDVGIITIIPTEINSLFEVLNITEEDIIKINSPFLYYKAKLFSVQSNSEISIVVSFINGDAGNIETSICTSHFLKNWYPKLMCIVGIGAGIRNKSKIGDVVIPSKIIDRTRKVYKDNKYGSRTESYLRPRIVEQMIKRFSISLDKFRALCNSCLYNEIKEATIMAKYYNLDEIVFTRDLSILDGSITSDDTLIRDSNYFTPIIDSVDEKCRGSEMESAGFIKACKTENENFPWLVFRGISDMGDSNKCDNFQVLASKSACLALKLYLENVILIEKLENNIHSGELSEYNDFNIYLQLEQAFNNQRWAEVCNMATFLSRYLWISGKLELRLKLGNMVNKASFEINNQNLRAVTLIDDLGWTSYSHGNTADAKIHISDGIRLANEISDYYVLTKGNRHLASINRRENRFSETEFYLTQADLYTEHIQDNDKRKEMLSGILVSKGKLYFSKRDYDYSIEKFTQALNIYKENHDIIRETKIYALIGRCYMKKLMNEKAVEFFRSGLNISYSIGRYDEISRNTKYLLECLDDRYILEKRELIKKILNFIVSKQLTYEHKKWSNYNF